MDGELFDFKIIEEWRFALGEDACLGEDDESQGDEVFQPDGVHDEVAASGDVDVLLNHISNELHNENSAVATRNMSEPGVDLAQVDSVEKAVPSLVVKATPAVTIESQDMDLGTKQPEVHKAGDIGDALVFNKSAATGYDRQPRQLHKKNAKRTTSCPPGRAYSVTASPWSLEWVNRQKSFATDVDCPLETSRKNLNPTGARRVLKKKGSGYIRHCAQNLKCIARLSEKDRKEALRAIHKSHKRREVVLKGSKDKINIIAPSSQSDSQASINNDWTNWLVLHGNDKVMSDDVRGIGKMVGLNFKGDKNNRFDVLSGTGRKDADGGGVEG